MFLHMRGTGVVNRHAADRVLAPQITLGVGLELGQAFWIAKVIQVTRMIECQIIFSMLDNHAAHRIPGNNRLPGTPRF